jgi:V/A-type H+-transporting ATPase subunit E
MNHEESSSSGVQELIERLHEEGLSKGQDQAEQLISKAREQAAEILEKAKSEADKILAAAISEAQQTRIAGEEAVRLAGRDTILRLNEELRADFDQKVRGLVGYTLKDNEFLKQLILEIARKSVPEDSTSPLYIELLLDETNASDSTGDSQDDPLGEFIRSLSGEALRDGLTFAVSDSEVPGVRVQVTDDHLEIDLSADTITHLLIKHLSPRFRAIVGQE